MRCNARCKLVLGVGLAALVGGTATGQFAADRVPPAGPPPGVAKTAPPPVPGGLTPVAPPSVPAPVANGYQPPPAPVAPVSPGGSLYTPTYSSPSAPGGYVPPVEAPRPPASGGPAAAVPDLAALPANVEIPSSLPRDHPWLLKPEHGPYFIIVKSYVRPAEGSKAAREEGEKWVSARALAEGLASEIRETHRVQALLYEYISEERKAEMRAHLLAKQKAETEYRAQLRAIEQRAQLQGFAWEPPDNKLRLRMHDQRDQIGVLVGGFQSEADAFKALTTLKKWEMPRNTALLDKGLTFTRTPDNKETAEAAYFNPYETAFVVPNPAIARAAQPVGRQGLDPLIVKLNDGRPYSLLKATKGWTLGVKSFTAPVELNKEHDTSLVRKWSSSKAADVLAAGAEQAEALAKVLRAMKGPRGEALNLEAFVLHTRTASLVTIGQFDAPDDPALLATKRILAGIRTTVSEDQTGTRPVMNAPSLFDTMLPVPIPKP